MSKDRRKLVLVGDDSSGKSSLLAVFSGGTFPTTPMHPAWWTTIHVDVQIDDREVELCPYDTSSFEDMDRLRPMRYPESDAIIICFGLDSVDSLDNVKAKWAPEVLRFCPDAPIILVGCKNDLRETSQRCITREERFLRITLQTLAPSSFPDCHTDPFVSRAWPSRRKLAQNIISNAPPSQAMVYMTSLYMQDQQHWTRGGRLVGSAGFPVSWFRSSGMIGLRK